MKESLFFLGSLIRWSAKQPRDFFALHLYILTAYGINHFIDSPEGTRLFFTLAVMTPLFLVISRGLPLNCLDYKSAVAKELES